MNGIPQGNPLALGPGNANELDNIRRVALDPASRELAVGAHQAREVTNSLAIGMIGQSFANSSRIINNSHDAKMEIARNACADTRQEDAQWSQQIFSTMQGKTGAEMLALIDILAKGKEAISEGNVKSSVKHGNDFDRKTDGTLEKTRRQRSEGLKAHSELGKSFHTALEQEEMRNHQIKTNALMQKNEEEKQANKRKEEQIKNNDLERKGQVEAKALGEATNRQNHAQAGEQLKIHMEAYNKDVEQAYKQIGSKRNAKLITTEPRIEHQGNGSYTVIPGKVEWETHGLF